MCHVEVAVLKELASFMGLTGFRPPLNLHAMR
jgi:hypothetical protein